MSEETSLFKAPSAPLATRNSIVDDTVQKAAGDGGFLPDLRIMQGNNVNDDNPVNSWRLGGTTNIGRDIKVVLCCWRFHAIRFKDNQVDAEDFNLTPNSSYNMDTNEWDHPDGHTPGYKEIMNKVVPDCNVKGQPQIGNCAGFDLLLWLPDHGKFATYLLAKTALKMPEPNVLQVAREYRGRTAILGAKTVPENPKPGGYRWSIPQIRLVDEDNPVPNTEANIEVFQKFINPGKVYDPTEAPVR